jgi:hypothetical protein
MRIEGCFSSLFDLSGRCLEVLPILFQNLIVFPLRKVGLSSNRFLPPVQQQKEFS